MNYYDYSLQNKRKEPYFNYVMDKLCTIPYMNVVKDPTLTLRNKSSLLTPSIFVMFFHKIVTYFNYEPLCMFYTKPFK